MRVLDSVLRKTLPWIYRVSDDAIRWFLFALAAFILGWGGVVLYEGMVCSFAQDG
jgi:P-type Cu+ transporter